MTFCIFSSLDSAQEHTRSPKAAQRRDLLLLLKMETSLLNKESPIPQLDGVDVNRPIGFTLETFAATPVRCQLPAKDLTLDTSTLKFLLAHHNTNNGSLQFITQPVSSLQANDINTQAVDIQITSLGADSDIHSAVTHASDPAIIQTADTIFQPFQTGDKDALTSHNQKEHVKSNFSDDEQRIKFISRKLKNIKANIDELYKKAGVSTISLAAYNGTIQLSGPSHLLSLGENDVFKNIFWNAVVNHEVSVAASEKSKRAEEKGKASLLPWSCDECNSSFSTQHNLVNHKLLSHSGLPVHKCEFCDKEFVDITILQKHLTTHTEKNQFQCKICGNSFAGKNLLDSHMKIHNDDKPYACKICGKTFNSTSSLQYHLHKHTGDKKCICIHCNKEFTKMSSLKVHMRIHSGEQPYRCQECGKGFVVSTHLTRHLRVHSGERPYLCEICGKRFNRSSHLRIHFRIHSGEKPYECEICGKRFNQTITRKKHLKTHAK